MNVVRIHRVHLICGCKCADSLTNWDCQVWKNPKQTNLCSSHLLFRLEGAAQRNEMFLCPSCTIIKVWGRVNYWVKFDFTCWTAEAKHRTEARFLCGRFCRHRGGLTRSQTSSFTIKPTPAQTLGRFLFCFLRNHEMTVHSLLWRRVCPILVVWEV